MLVDILISTIYSNNLEWLRKVRGGGRNMTFWIIASILILVIAVLAAYGPYLGLYGDIEKKGEEK